MAYMYGENILRVDLSEGKVSKEPTTSYSDAYVGGRGINIRLLYNGVPPDTDPLDPANLIIFGVGPLCGTPVPASRVEVTARSPETGFLGSSNFGGYFGPEFKFAGYDNIVITGRADKPVYIWIENERVEIRDASKIWGKDTYETQAIIRSEVDPEARVVCIGQAGENLVRFATVQHELGHGAGRTGMGCVMGSKNLKAIVVRGTKGITLANPEKYLSIAEELQEELRSIPELQEIREHGMSRLLDMGGSYLYADPDWKPTVRLYDLYLKHKPKKTGCFGCPVQCMDLYPVEAKGGVVISCTIYHAPIYEVRNNDTDVLLETSLWAHRYGVDIISLMGMISWLMRLYEGGVITAEDTDGIPMEWGSREAIMGMFRKIVNREGFGDVLADGILPAAERIGRGSEDYAYHMKGLLLYSPTTSDNLVSQKGKSLGMAVSSRGDTMRSLGGRQEIHPEWVRELASWYDDKTAAEYVQAARQTAKEITGTEKAALPEEYEGKAELVAYTENIKTINDLLGTCKLMGGYGTSPSTNKHWARLLSVGSGVKTSEDTLFEYAKRVRNLERAYNVREGMTRDTDSLPKGFTDKPVERGVFKGSVLESGKFEEMKSKYYALRGWDVATGIPTRETLEKTGLRDIARDLRKRGKLPGKKPVGQEA